MFLTAHKDPRGGHNRAKINSNFFKNWSPQMAYTLGYIFADGAIEDVQKSSRTCYLAIGSNDLPILRKIRKSLNSKHILYKRKPRTTVFPDGKSYESHTGYVLRIGSKIIYNDLLALGVTPRKSLTIQFPRIANKYLPFFIRGYFDGDGCVYMIKMKYPRGVFTSGSKIFLDKLGIILARSLQIPIKIPYVQIQASNNFCYHLQYSSKTSKKILGFIYKDLSKAPFLDRKYKIYKNLVS